MAVTNYEFGRLVGVDYTTASRYRNGNRMPGDDKLDTIWEVFELPVEDRAFATKNKDNLSSYLRRNVFGDES